MYISDGIHVYVITTKTYHILVYTFLYSYCTCVYILTLYYIILVYTVLLQDLMGNGYLKRADIIELLEITGFGYFSKIQILDVLKLFETNGNGSGSSDNMVNYGNMIEYILENGISNEVRELSIWLYTIITTTDPTDNTTNTNSASNNITSTLNDKVIRAWYKRIDTALKGVFNIEQFSTFLHSLASTSNTTSTGDLGVPNLSQDVIMALYIHMDTENSGVRLNNFATWLRSFPSIYTTADSKGDSKGNNSLNLALFPSLSLAEIKTKIHTYMRYISESKEVTIDEVSSSFMIYDWCTPATGEIEPSAFIYAIHRAGFPLTLADCRVLETEFVVHKGSTRLVSYIR